LKVLVVAVGKPGPLFADAIVEYERRARRYWSLETIEVKEERTRKNTPARLASAAESDRLLARVPPGFLLFALTRTGDATSSERLARDLERHAVAGSAGIAFLIGGAHGLSDHALQTADRRIRLSTVTLPHDLARVVLLEQLYRAGTIVRGEPYHKGRE
jgi:23S rRNA (pseudouridine1915-N3)-methyltransferase